jgi:hypothetical protein
MDAAHAASAAVSPPGLTIEGVDALLSTWEKRLRRLDDNLIALESDAAYQRLAGVAGRRAALLGVSAERVHPALDAVTELFQQREQLADVVARARAARASISALTFWDRDEKLALVARLLRAPSIDAGVRSTPLAELGLLDEAERELRVEPEALLAAMARTFDQARDVILAVARAWKALSPPIEALDREIQALRALPAHQIEGVAAELAAAERELAALSAFVDQDPLGCLARPEKPSIPGLIAIRSRLEVDAAAASRVAAALDRGRALQRSLREVHARAVDAFAAASLAIDDAAEALAPPLDEPRIGGLDGWLTKLTETAAARRTGAAEVGLARFCETAEGYLAHDQRAAAIASAAIGARAELAGRLSARRAQAAALTARAGVDPAALEARARDADALLRAHPLSLARARLAVEAYEAEVVALSRR